MEYLLSQVTNQENPQSYRRPRTSGEYCMWTMNTDILITNQFNSDGRS